MYNIEEDQKNKLRIQTIEKCKEKCFENKEEVYSIFSGFTSALFNIKDSLKFNLISFNTKFVPSEDIKNNVNLFNKTYSTPNLDILNEKIKQLIYISYRSNYKPQYTKDNETEYTSDCGWGCMIRSSQMILARGIYKLFKYKERKKGAKIDKNFLIKSVIYFFLDNNLNIQIDLGQNYYGMENYIKTIYKLNKSYKGITSIEPPFNIQKICILGELTGKTCGEWFSDYDLPNIYSTINRSFNVFPDVEILHFNSNIDLNTFFKRCFIAKDNKNKQEKYITYQKQKYYFNKIGLIFISVRLGLETILSDYYPSIKNLFKCKECIGFMGGKTYSASYFIGYVGNELIYMDPHYNQNSIKNLEKEGINSYIEKSLYKLNFTKLQTAFTIGFLCRDIDEYIDFLKYSVDMTKNIFCYYISNEKDLELESE